MLLRFLFFALFVLFSKISFSQNQKINIYRSSNEKINNLVHTKINVSFDYKNRYLNGEAWITLKPHFYPTDSLKLDAKGMDIFQVKLIQDDKELNLKYVYDSLKLSINLGKTFKSSEKYTIYIKYKAKPDELKSKGSTAITNAKGLYFINPDSTIAGKPVQIWTQGETESSSVWFPTIDSPNQKTTQEINMTVLDKYVSLSNGTLISKKKNKDGTRTDTWKLDQAHAPYLFMMAVGDFKIYHDKWKNIPVDYYLEPEYAPYAKNIFGNTPEMLEFFSNLLGVAYPWEKYSQIVVRDFVSGAMENTTATIHGDFVQQTDRELLDGSAGEEVIAHEVFHHWFGNYVTTESWSNLSVNESFADLSESLWLSYKYGTDAGDAHSYEAMYNYLSTPDAKLKKLLRYHYHDKEDMFDVVSYQKGGRILNMLKNYLGDEAFYAGLNLYLKDNALKTGEVHQLRLALEEISGKDLNWFFNQWYLREGHPILDIKYNWIAQSNTQQIIISQQQDQDVFKLPMKIAIYLDGTKKSYDYWMDKKTDTLNYILKTKPQLINVDADKILLIKKNDHKTLEEYAFQIKNAPLYVDRLEALDATIKDPSNPLSQEILLTALHDKYSKIKIKALEKLNLSKTNNKSKVIEVLKNIILNDESTLTKAAAIDALATTKDASFDAIYREASKSKSYAVQAAALTAIADYHTNAAFLLAKYLEKESKGPLSVSISNIYAKTGSESDFIFVHKAFKEVDLKFKMELIPDYLLMLNKVNDTSLIKESINTLFDFGQQYKAYGIDKYIEGLFESFIISKKESLNKAKKDTKEDIKKQIDYAEQKIKETNNLL